MRQSPRVLLILLGILLSQGAVAQEGGVAFLRIGVDAPGLAFGDGGVALTHGALAAERNPAGLAASQGSELSLGHIRWIADQRTYSGAARLSLSNRLAGSLFVRATGSGDFDARNTPGPADGTFDAQFVTAGAGLGRSFGAVRVGVTARFISERIFDVSSDGYAFDFGAQADLLQGGLQIGAVWQYLGKMDRLGTQRSSLPESIRLGAAVHPFRILAWLDGSVILDAALTADWSRNTASGEEQFHFGLTATVLETVLARLGYVTNDDLRSYSAGIGVNLKPFVLDYAIMPFDSGFGGPGHAFSFTYLL